MRSWKTFSCRASAVLKGRRFPLLHSRSSSTKAAACGARAPAPAAATPSGRTTGTASGSREGRLDRRSRLAQLDGRQRPHPLLPAVPAGKSIKQTAPAPPPPNTTQPPRPRCTAAHLAHQMAAFSKWMSISAAFDSIWRSAGRSRHERLRLRGPQRRSSQP